MPRRLTRQTDSAVTSGDGENTYSVTLERGTDGTCLAWVDDLPGCAVRGASKEDVLSKLPAAIGEFVAWTGATYSGTTQITVADEVESAIEAEEDTEVLVAARRLIWHELLHLRAMELRESNEAPF